MGLNEKLIEVVGDEEKVKLIQKEVGDTFIPKEEYAKVKKQLTDIQADLEKTKLANMDKEQVAQHELEKTKALQTELEIKLNKVEAERSFVNAGFTSDVYADLLDQIVSNDKERTMATVNKFISVLGKEKENTANRTKESLLNQTKQPDKSDADSTTNKTVKKFTL